MNQTGFHFLLILSLLFFSACKRQTVIEQSLKSQELHLGNGAEPVSLDPHVTSSLSAANIHLALFEGLTSLHPENLSPQAGVAKSWDIKNNGTRYLFHLNPNAKWSNGDKLLAEDFVYSWKRSLTKKLGAPFASFYFPIKGAKTYYNEENNDFASVGIRAIDPHTLEVELEHPVPYFLSLIAHHAFAPVHRPTIEHFLAFDTIGTAWDTPKNLVSNGAFSLKERVRSKKIKVTQNPHYWDAKSVQLKAIYFYPYDSSTAEENAFLAGQIHKTESLSAGKADWYKRKMPQSLRLEPFFGTYYYALNTTKAPLDNPMVRKALSLSISRGLITDKLLGGGRLPARSFTPPGMNDYRPPQEVKEDIDEAKRLLSKAGYPNGENFPELELLFNTSESHRLLAEAIQEMWKKNLGIKVRLHNEEWKSCLERRKIGDFEILRSSWVADYPDISNFLELLNTHSNNNFSRYSNLEYDRLLQAAAQEQDSNKRNTIFSTAERQMLEEMPIIPIYYYTSNYLIHPNVRGWHPNPLNIHPYKYVSISRAETKSK